MIAKEFPIIYDNLTRVAVFGKKSVEGVFIWKKKSKTEGRTLIKEILIKSYFYPRLYDSDLQLKKT